MVQKGMRVKEMGATINLGNYSSLHVTIGEQTEFAGLDIGRAENYLRKIAKSVNGVLNLPEEETKVEKKEISATTPQGEQLFAYGSGEKIYYNNSAHSYTDDKGINYTSVTQLVGHFYPMNKGIAKEYLDFASSYGKMIHTAIQNSIIGKPPVKDLIQPIINSTLEAMGEVIKPVVEQVLVYPEQEIAGRFDILSEDNDGNKILWDVKTNSNLFMKAKSSLPKEIKDEFSNYWNPDTLYGEHCLQLNIYAHILKNHCGINVSKIKIIHIPDGFKEIIDIPIVDISKVFDAYNQNR